MIKNPQKSKIKINIVNSDENPQALQQVEIPGISVQQNGGDEATDQVIQIMGGEQMLNQFANALQARPNDIRNDLEEIRPMTTNVAISTGYPNTNCSF